MLDYFINTDDCEIDSHARSQGKLGARWTSAA